MSYLNTMMSVSMLISLIMTIFYLMSMKEKWEKMKATTFECGFTSYFFSRFSFSIHYFLIALLFLFLDLELCFMMPFMNQPMTTQNMKLNMLSLLTALMLSLLTEWKEGKLEWKF